MPPCNFDDQRQCGDGERNNAGRLEIERERDERKRERERALEAQVYHIF
jgi:hypothetical protein